MSRPGTVWWGKPGRPHWEEWSLDGRYLRAVVGDLPWFPDDQPAQPQGPRPISRMGYFGVDAQDRLWILTEVPDLNWEEIEFVRTEEGWAPASNVRPDELRDARLDVFDLKGRRHLGHFRWDGVYPALMVMEGGNGRQCRGVRRRPYAASGDLSVAVRLTRDSADTLALQTSSRQDRVGGSGSAPLAAVVVLRPQLFQQGPP